MKFLRGFIDWLTPSFNSRKTVKELEKSEHRQLLAKVPQATLGAPYVARRSECVNVCENNIHKVVDDYLFKVERLEGERVNLVKFWCDKAAIFACGIWRGELLNLTDEDADIDLSEVVARASITGACQILNGHTKPVTYLKRIKKRPPFNYDYFNSEEKAEFKAILKRLSPERQSQSTSDTEQSLSNFLCGWLKKA